MNMITTIATIIEMDNVSRMIIILKIMMLLR